MPREARSAAGWRLAIPGHPCTPNAGAATDAASARVDGQGHHFGCGVDQPDYYASPLAFRLARVVLPVTLRVPKGNTLRISSTIGFNPAGGANVSEADPPPFQEIVGGWTIPKDRIRGNRTWGVPKMSLAHASLGRTLR